ncbi:MAG: hypothetical protein QNJ16_11740, partial [Rhodobacter sp.]|nr:hypothetical protein [Rhodobacter sp.]
YGLGRHGQYRSTWFATQILRAAAACFFRSAIRIDAASAPGLAEWLLTGPEAASMRIADLKKHAAAALSIWVANQVLRY